MLFNRYRRRLDRVSPADASLLLDFGEGMARANGRALALLPLLGTTRNSEAWSVGDNGLLVRAGANVPRIERRPGEGGLVIERATQNFCLFGSNLNADPWIKTAMSVVANFTAAQDGTRTASYVVDNAPTGSAPGTVGQTVAIPNTNGQWWTGQIGIRQILGRRIKMYVGIAGGSQASGGNVVFDTQTGCVVSTDAGIVGRVLRGTNGFLTLAVSVPNTYGGGALVMQLSRPNASDSPIWFFADRAQIEAGTAPSSAMPTTTGNALRGQDVVTVDLTQGALAGSVNPNEGTIVADAWLRGPIENNQALVAVGDTIASWLSIGRTGYSGSTYVNSIGIASISAGQTQAVGGTINIGNLPRRIRVAFRYGAQSFAAAVGGSQYGYGTEPFARFGILQATNSNAGIVPAGLSKLQLGHVNGGTPLDGVLRKVALFPTALADSDLSQLVL